MDSTDCQENAVRLVSGSTNKEGRVEMCVDGQWGTIKVCREPNEIAKVVGVLCYRLGFSRESKLYIAMHMPLSVVTVFFSYRCQFLLFWNWLWPYSQYYMYFPEP